MIFIPCVQRILESTTDNIACAVYTWARIEKRLRATSGFEEMKLATKIYSPHFSMEVNYVPRRFRIQCGRHLYGTTKKAEATTQSLNNKSPMATGFKKE